MNFYKSKHGRLCALLLICLIVSGYFNFNYAKQNKKYEKHFYVEIGNTLRQMGSDMKNAKNYIDKINSSTSITQKDLYDMAIYYRGFVLGMHEMEYFYEITGDRRYREEFTKSNYYTLYDEIFLLSQDLIIGNKSVYNITDDDKVVFVQMQKMTKDILSVFGDDFYNWDFAILKDEWIDIFTKLDNACKKKYS